VRVLEAPDPDSRSPEFEGRRIERVDGGYLVLSYPRVLEAGMIAERREYLRQKKRESRKRRQKLDADGLPLGRAPVGRREPPERRLGPDSDLDPEGGSGI
jgi:hypothetical protein